MYRLNNLLRMKREWEHKPNQTKTKSMVGNLLYTKLMVGTPLVHIFAMHGPDNRWLDDSHHILS